MLNKYFHYHRATEPAYGKYSPANGLQNGADKTATIKSVKGLVSPFVVFRHTSNCQIKIK